MRSAAHRGGFRDEGRERKKFPARRPMTSMFLAGFLGVFVGAAVTWSIVAALATGRIPWKNRPRRMTVCPECSGPAEGFATDNTTEESVDSTPDSIMTCRRIVSESPFEECGFTVLRSLLDIPWLRVHGVGGTCSAGQTMWHAACLGLVDPFRSTTMGEMEMIPCSGAWGPRSTWDTVCLHRQWPPATQTTAVPKPWLLQVRKAESRRKRLAVAVSDFPGEVASRSCTSEKYDQLVHAECHLFFVDLLAAERETHQLSVFHDFLIGLRGRRGLANCDRPIGPIAVCISKCDLIPDLYSDSRSQQATRFIGQLRASGPCNAWTTLTAIRRRHELVVTHAEILPCVERLGRRLQTDCGPEGFIFFPMTAVGWLPDGETKASAYTLADRPITPWGVLDPLLWLIHASGFETLPA
jgi:hypothetical protein